MLLTPAEMGGQHGHNERVSLKNLRLALAETYLAAGDPRKALQNARNALDRSEHPDCQYAWGKADGLHFCGLAHLRLGERELAQQPPPPPSSSASLASAASPFGWA